MRKFDVILSTDRSLMTNHHGKEFLGFGTTMPIILPRKFIQWLFCPPMKHEDGIVWQAPYGLRRIEARLVHDGINAAVIDPDYVPKYIERGAKVLIIRHHDWFGLNPPTTTWTAFIDKEPLNAVLFREFIESVCKLRDKYDFKIIVTGPAVWQWLHMNDLIDKYQIDVIVDSNGDREEIVVSRIVKRILEGKPVPSYIKMGIKDNLTLDKLVPIIHASVNGLIEIGRGCPRKCAFCSVGSRPVRWYPLEFIEKEIQVNVKEGVDHGILSCTDVLLYGSDSVIPNENAVLKVNMLAKKYWRQVGWSHCTLAAAVANKKLIDAVTEVLIDGENQKLLGVEVGVESGSVKLMRMHMPAKSKPFPIEKWPEIVEEAFALFHEHNIVPAATIIVGLPGEDEDDVKATTELIKRLRPYRSLIVPMFFVPMGPSRLGRQEWFRKIKPYHVELLMACLDHALYWAEKLVEEYMTDRKYFLIKRALRWFLNKVKENRSKVEQKLREFAEANT
ncbi:MAG: B12-binding domain-containing radical SAM protein [Crenarchaeota archaeon]|nr:B12-binding domain-containing radical SAM protein [Thermoproteota archaeon]